MPVSFRSGLFTPYILTIFKQWKYSCKYEKLSNIVVHACKILQKKWICWKCVARKFGFVYLHFDPLRRNSSKAQLQSIPSINSWCSGYASALGVKVPGSIPDSDKGFYVWSFCFVVCLPFCQKHIIYTKFCNFFCNVKLFNILNIL